MNTKLLYLAGPYRAATPDGVDANIRRARETAEEIVNYFPGWFPITPHLLTAHMDGLAPDKYFLRGTMELMRRCDAVLMIPGWEASVGSIAERLEALERRMPVFYSIMELRGEDGKDL